MAKFMFDLLPAALASLIGGFLVTHYGLARPIERAVQAAPASAEMMQLLRDEHGVMLNFLKAQLAEQKRRLAAGDALRHNPDPELARANGTAHQAPVARIGSKSLRDKGSGTGAALSPLMIVAARPAMHDAFYAMSRKDR